MDRVLSEESWSRMCLVMVMNAIVFGPVRGDSGRGSSLSEVFVHWRGRFELKCVLALGRGLSTVSEREGFRRWMVLIGPQT